MGHLLLVGLVGDREDGDHVGCLKVQQLVDAALNRAFLLIAELGSVALGVRLVEALDIRFAELGRLVVPLGLEDRA